MHANKREEIKQVYAGDIAAAVGLKYSTTGDTLCDVNNQVILESMEFPEPVIHLSVEPKTKSDQEKMGVALGKLLSEDPSLRVRTDEETGQTILSGMGELHLDVIVDRMKREFKVECNIGAPQVAYRESITQTIEVQGKFARQSGGRGQYGDCCFVLSRVSLVMALFSSIKSRAVSFLVNTFLLSARVLKRPQRMVSWPDSRSLMSR